MKTNFMCRLVFLMVVLFGTQYIFAAREDLESILIFGCKNLPYADLNYENLDHCNLDGLKIPFAWLDDANFKKSSLRGADLSFVKAPNSGFRWADLEGADLSGADFTGALFFGANLKNAKVKNTIFGKVRGLTNDPKRDLISNGTQKVPADLKSEEFEKERLQVEKEIKSSIAYKFNKLFKRFFCCKKK